MGINNRNLHDFRVDLKITLALRSHVPAEICLVTESGFHSRQEVERVRPDGEAARSGVDAILVGETVALGRPFIAMAYIPGQEQANLSFIERHRLGWVALEAEEQRSLLSWLHQEPGGMAGMMAGVAAYRQWNFEHVAQIPRLVMGMLAAPHGF